jgi:transcriptional regulator with XRE-family HTH domain
MAANDRLRAALNAAGLTPQALAEHLGVDPKTVARWVTLGRAPYPRYRSQVAALLKESEAYLWPDATTEAARERASESEIVHIYPRRADLSIETWRRLFEVATEQIDIMVYAGLFLPEQQPQLLEVLYTKAATGIPVRVLLGDPNCDAVRTRSEEEGIGRETISVKIMNALALYRPHIGTGGLNVRLHTTTLYTSIYRADDQMYANTHVYGLPAAQAPVMHLRRLPGADLFETYARTFERVWSEAMPATLKPGEAVA